MTALARGARVRVVDGRAGTVIAVWTSRVPTGFRTWRPEGWARVVIDGGTARPAILASRLEVIE